MVKCKEKEFTSTCANTKWKCVLFGREDRNILLG